MSIQGKERKKQKPKKQKQSPAEEYTSDDWWKSQMGPFNLGMEIASVGPGDLISSVLY
jgi:hypothetical protein